jgi:hypothetical protein
VTGVIGSWADGEADGPIMEDACKRLIEALNAAQDQQLSPSAFDQYRSLGDSTLMIFVAKDAVPPFRFKAGGWELLKSAIDLGPAMKARITERGYFLCRVKDDRSGWTELTDPSGGRLPDAL